MLGLDVDYITTDRSDTHGGNDWGETATPFSDEDMLGLDVEQLLFRRAVVAEAGVLISAPGHPSQVWADQAAVLSYANRSASPAKFFRRVETETTAMLESATFREAHAALTALLVSEGSVESWEIDDVLAPFVGAALVGQP
jgi:hypothetical protein